MRARSSLPSLPLREVDQKKSIASFRARSVEGGYYPGFYRTKVTMFRAALRRLPAASCELSHILSKLLQCFLCDYTQVEAQGEDPLSESDILLSLIPCLRPTVRSCLSMPG